MKGISSSFYFHTTIKKIAKLITNLHNKKAVQSMDIPTKLSGLAACFQVLLFPTLINA